jgi:proliferating cell nuclear antigen
MTLGVSITNLAKVLKLAGNEDKIILKAEEDASYLSITFENRSKCDSTLLTSNLALGQEKKTEFNLNLITLDSEHLGIPETAYTSEITMNSFDFSKLCKELHQLSETVTIEASLHYVKFSIEGEVGSGVIQIQTNDSERASEMAKQGSFDKVVLSFALRYLNMFNKASTLCNFVKLMLASDTPLVVEYEIENLGSLKYYLAPKINEND